VEDRLMSMRVIESHRHAEAIPTLLELLEDVSPRVRVVSARVLSTLAVGGNESLIGRALLASLSKEWNHEVRATIIISLGELRKKEFLSPLLPLLHDENDRVRANAIEAVGRSMERRIILRHLEAMLKDKNNRARANAALAIWVMGEKSGFKELLHMAASEDPLMCCSGLFGIGEVFAEANMRILTDFISDPVAFYTGEQKSLFQPAFELCVKGLAFPHKLVERNAVLALKKMKTMLCVPLLTQKYGETDDDFVRQLIIETLLSLELFAQAAALKGGIVSSVAEGNKA
jgi:HEAT repeat protein